MRDFENRIICGDCVKIMKRIDDNSVDSIITDPPYGLTSIQKRFGKENSAPAQFGKDGSFSRLSGGFMGKKWDGTGIENSVEMWSQCLRVLKPGGHLLAFGGTRTYHRMACAIEDAGFEIRDMIEFVYGSGFPKSLNIGKAIDKLGQNPYGWIEFSKAYKKIVEESKYNHNDIDNYLGIKASSCYWARTDDRGGLPPRHHWEKVKEFIGLDSRYDELYDEVEREVLGQKQVMGKDDDIIYGKYKGGIVNITKGTSVWEGYGTALKPAHEPICLARKPLAEKSVALNVLKYGTGGINIDESRVEMKGNKGFWPEKQYGDKDEQAQVFKGRGINPENSLGRFPANLIHDNSEEVRECFPETKSGALKPYKENHRNASSYKFEREKTFTQDANSGNASRFFKSIKQPYVYKGKEYKVDGFVKNCKPQAPSNYNDDGSPARYFKSIIYQSKASKAERNLGCEGLEEKENQQKHGFDRGEKSFNGMPSKNNHPTVKPIALMEYLIKMITPKGGIVLDPFAGSGSTLVAAKQNGFQYIGIEKEKEYCEIAKARIKAVSIQQNLI